MPNAQLRAHATGLLAQAEGDQASFDRVVELRGQVKTLADGPLAFQAKAFTDTLKAMADSQSANLEPTLAGARDNIGKAETLVLTLTLVALV